MLKYHVTSQCKDLNPTSEANVILPVKPPFPVPAPIIVTINQDYNPKCSHQLSTQRVTEMLNTKVNEWGSCRHVGPSCQSSFSNCRLITIRSEYFETTCCFPESVFIVSLADHVVSLAVNIKLDKYIRIILKQGQLEQAFQRIIYMSHFAYACKMWYPLNLVLEKSEYLWFY